MGRQLECLVAEGAEECTGLCEQAIEVRLIPSVDRSKPVGEAARERLGHLRQLGVGVALWELGDGLDYFYDLI